MEADRIGLSPVPKPFAVFDRRYTLRIAELASGGFGKVAVYADKQTGVEVAVKLGKENANATIYERVETINRTKHEISTYLRLQEPDPVTGSKGHPNVIQLIDFYQDHKLGSIKSVYEYCHGNLEERFWKQYRRVLTEDEAMPITHQLADAINFLHNKNIVHRDLKMENILCADKVHLSPVKVCDFDICKKGDMNLSVSPMITPVGTMVTMSPEVAQNFANSQMGNTAKIVDYGKNIDTWAIGCILFRLLTRRDPHDQWLVTCGRSDCPAAGDPLLFRRCGNCNDEYMKTVFTVSFDVSSSAVKNRSVQCKDLIEKLLDSDRNRRIQVSAIMNHPWVKPASRLVANTSKLQDRSVVAQKAFVKPLATPFPGKKQVPAAPPRPADKTPGPSPMVPPKSATKIYKPIMKQPGREGSQQSYSTSDPKENGPVRYFGQFDDGKGFPNFAPMPGMSMEENQIDNLFKRYSDWLKDMA